MCDFECTYTRSCDIEWFPLCLKRRDLFCCLVHDSFHYCSPGETSKYCRVEEGEHICCTISGIVKGINTKESLHNCSQANQPEPMVEDVLNVFLSDTEENRHNFCHSILGGIPHNLTYAEISALYDSLHNGLVSRFNKFARKNARNANRFVREGILQALIETNRVTKQLQHTSFRNNRWKDSFKKAVILSLSVNAVIKAPLKKRAEVKRRKIINNSFKRRIDPYK